MPLSPIPPLLSPPGSISEPPTMVRYGVLSLTVAMAVVLYLDRMAISVAVPAIAADLELELTQVGDSVAAFFWCYALFQVPAGLLGDRWGGRRALTLYVIAWSLAMAGLGMANGLLSLLLMRALLGIGQAGAFATSASFLRRWIPFGRRGFANSAVSLGGRAGGVLAPLLTPALMGLAQGWGYENDRWRLAFLIYALVGIAWAIGFWLWFRDEPRLHAACNSTEILLIDGDEGYSAGLSASQSIPMRAIIGCRGLQLLCLINFFINVGWIFLATWLPTYLITVHGKSEQQAGFYTSLTAAAGMGGCLAGGFATDFLVKRLGLVWGRRLPGMISYGGAALGLSLCWTLDDVNAIVAVLVVSSFFGDFALGALWSTYQDIGGPLSGTVLGWANMCGNIGAACAISTIGRIVDNYGWSPTFVMASSAYLIAAVTWLLVDPRVSVHIRASDPAPLSA